MRAIWKIGFMTGACNAVAVVHGLIYGWLTVLPEIRAEDRLLVFLWAAIAVILSYICSPLIYSLLYRPIVRALAAGDEIETLEPELLENARRLTVNMPIYITRQSTYIWIISALSFLPIYLLLRPEGSVLLALHVAMVTILIGSVSGIFVYYSSEWYSRSRILPRLAPTEGLSHIKGVIGPTTQFKIVMLIVTSSAMPIVVITIGSVLGNLTSNAIIYLGSTFVGLGALQGVTIARSITRPIDSVVREMAKVRDGDLGARAQVFSVDAVGRLAEGFNEMVEGLGRAELIRDSFGRYVSRDVLDKVLEGDIALGGEMRQATVLFSDIRDFTTITEKMPPEELLMQLNGYLDIMVDAVVKHGGRVDKFIGDSVMAVFGVPLNQDDHALRAVKAGLEMLRRLDEWNAGLDPARYDSWKMGIGVHSGEVIAGNIGSAKKMEYAVIGDVVNTASRIEQLDKRFNAGLLISEETYRLASKSIEAEKLDTVSVKGKSEPVTVYKVIRKK